MLRTFFRTDLGYGAVEREFDRFSAPFSAVGALPVLRLFGVVKSWS
ncbi:MAG TPA: hypothetical protein P5186_21235 [Candidatus Paceibacterota bacterium]|nr:hypothetical protein [Candidatus Paceibacterota bacterium]